MRGGAFVVRIFFSFFFLIPVVRIQSSVINVNVISYCYKLIVFYDKIND